MRVNDSAALATLKAAGAAIGSLLEGRHWDGRGEARRSGVQGHRCRSAVDSGGPGVW